MAQPANVRLIRDAVEQFFSARQAADFALRERDAAARRLAEVLDLLEGEEKTLVVDGEIVIVAFACGRYHVQTRTINLRV